MTLTPKPRRFPIRSEEALKNLALRQAARFPGSVQRMRQYLVTKMREAITAGEAQSSDAGTWIEGVVATLLRVRLLDDDAFAAARASTLQRRGRATSFITRDLARQGLARTAIESAVASLEVTPGESPDLQAAVRLAKKKKLGPFASLPLTPRDRQRHLATLARAGFSFDLARRVLEASSPEALEELSR